MTRFITNWVIFIYGELKWVKQGSSIASVTKFWFYNESES